MPSSTKSASVLTQLKVYGCEDFKIVPSIYHSKEALTCMAHDLDTDQKFDVYLPERLFREVVDSEEKCSLLNSFKYFIYLGADEDYNNANLFRFYINLEEAKDVLQKLKDAIA